MAGWRRWVSVVSVVAIALTAFAPGAAAQGSPAGAAKKSAAKPSKEVIDINAASKEQLMSLPGIGPSFADKIIAGRPYKGKDDLVSKDIIPKATYKRISKRLIAKQNT